MPNVLLGTAKTENQGNHKHFDFPCPKTFISMLLKRIKAKSNTKRYHLSFGRLKTITHCLISYLTILQGKTRYGTCPLGLFPFLYHHTKYYKLLHVFYSIHSFPFPCTHHLPALRPALVFSDSLTKWITILPILSAFDNTNVLKTSH